MGRVRTGREIDAALRRKGFTCKSDGKHLRYSYILPGGNKAAVNTLISHGMMGSALSANLISRMARQLRLTKNEFLKLIDCTLDENGYREILQKTTDNT